MSKITLYGAKDLAEQFLIDLKLKNCKIDEYGNKISFPRLAVDGNSESTIITKYKAELQVTEILGKNMLTGRNCYAVDIIDVNSGAVHIGAYSQYDADSLIEAIEKAQMDIVNEVRQNWKDQQNFSRINMENLTTALVDALLDKEIVVDFQERTDDDMFCKAFFNGKEIYCDVVGGYSYSYNELAEKIAKTIEAEPAKYHILFNAIKPWKYEIQETAHKSKKSDMER